jgi:hypothetical protein
LLLCQISVNASARPAYFIHSKTWTNDLETFNLATPRFPPPAKPRMLAPVPVGQQFLFAPEKPLVTRLGVEFFRNLPKSAGVYKMHDARGAILYVGKARNLRQRLGSYRVANPERMARRHLRLLQQVVRIEFDLCEDELTALRHEAKLIRELKPKFNRAGVWQGKPKFLLWRAVRTYGVPPSGGFANADAVEMQVREEPVEGWNSIGSLGAYAARLRTVLLRLLWFTLNPEKSICDMPCGWMHGELPEIVSVPCSEPEAICFHLESVLNGETPDWLLRLLADQRSTFELAAIASDLEELQEFIERQQRRTAKTTSP